VDDLCHHRITVASQFVQQKSNQPMNIAVALPLRAPSSLSLALLSVHLLFDIRW
jgi:hypothetical protein